MVQEELTCKTCKHWYLDEFHKRLDGRQICLLTTSVAENQPNGALTPGYLDSSAIATSKVIAPFNGGNVVTALETGPEFDCNQHGAK